MTPDEVAQYLRAHPEIFERHPQLLETISVPHPYGGRTISLAERQIVSLREKVRALEAKLAELIRIGEDNDAISEKVHRLALALAGAPDFEAAAAALVFHLREDFAVPHVALRFWGAGEGSRTSGAPVAPALREQVATMGAPVCGPAAGSPFLSLFGEAADRLRSIAVVPLGQTRAVGVLALASEDPQRFYADMGTLYLRRIGELAAGALAARS
ncbi:MAG: DUF484 family protein [Burkholderiales bacterium]|nr:DUF484 family protein [Burkholderiales bacterium]